MNEIEMIGNQPELIAIKEKYKVDDERFVRGVIFAEYLVNGESANMAYHYAFEVDKKEASKYSANFRNTKWVQELILFFKPDENTLYFGETRQVIRKLMGIIDSPASEDKDIISAANALSKYIKPGTKIDEKDLATASAAQQLIGSLLEGINELSSQNKMVGPGGQIIDVPVLE